MAFVAGLERQRRMLSNLGKKFRKAFQPNPMIEALEPRAMFSMVPSGVAATSYGTVTDSTQVISAATSAGLHVVAWTGTKIAATGIYYDVRQADGTQVGSTGFIAVVGGASSIDLTVNGTTGAIAWLVSDVIHAQRIDLSTAATSGSEATITAANSTHITDFDVVLDSSANIGALWLQSATYSIKPTAIASAQNFTSNSLFYAVNASGGTTWTSTATVVDATTRVGDAKLGDIQGIDLALSSDGKFIAAWQASTLSFVYDDAFGTYNTLTTKLDTSFRTYLAAGTASAEAVSVGSKTATRGIEQASIKIATDTNGKFAIAQNVTFYVSQNGDSTTEQTYDVLTVRSYDLTNKKLALGNEIEVARTDTHNQFTDFAIAYDSTHNIVFVWQQYNPDNEAGTVLAQSYTTTGAKVGTTTTLNLDIGSYTSIGDINLLSSQTGFKVTYLAYKFNVATSKVNGSIQSQKFGDAIADLTVSFGNNTIKPTIKSGTTTVTTLPIIITNNGNSTADGTATIVVKLVPSGAGSTVVLANLTGQILNIKAGKSQTITIKNFTIPSTAFSGEGDYQIVAEIKDAVSTVDYSTANNTASFGVKLIGTTSTYTDLGIASVTSTFTQPVLVSGDTGTISVTLRNNGSTAITKQAITVKISASTDGLFSDALLLLSKSVTVSLAAGASTTLKLSVTITQALAKGTYKFAAQITPPNTLADANSSNDTAATTTSNNVLWSFGNVAGRTKTTSLVWFNNDGSKTTYSLTGPGYAEISFNPGDLPGKTKDEASSILDLSYIETTSTSKLSIASSKKDTVLQIGNIFGYADINSISAAKVNLLGNAALQTISTLALGDMAANATQEINIVSTSTTAAVITLGKADRLMLKSGQAISKLTATDWSGTGAYIEASTIGTLSITGNTASSLAGNLQAKIILTGVDKNNDGNADSGAVALGTLSVAGLMSNTAIRAAGNITSITAGAADTVSILAGVKSAIQDVTDSSPTTLLPDDNTDMTDLYSKIGSVTFKGKVGTTVTASTDFYIAAGSVGSLNLGLLAKGDATAWGVAVFASSTTPVKTTAYTSIGLSYADGGTKPVVASVKPANQTAALPTLATKLNFNLYVLARPVASSQSVYTEDSGVK